MNFTIAVYQRREGGWLEWTTLGLGEHTCTQNGYSANKLQQLLTKDLRAKVEKLPARDLESFQLQRGGKLFQVRIELTLRGEGKRRKVSGLCPVVVEPRWASETRRLKIAYHPAFQQSWFPVNEERTLAEQATLFFQTLWANLDDAALSDLWSNGKDSLRPISFSARPRSVIDDLPDPVHGVWDDLVADDRTKGKKKKKHEGYVVMWNLATHLTTLVTQGSLDLGLPRSPYREQLHLLLGSPRKTPTVLLGPHGSGKTTLLHRWVSDQLDADDYPAHRNIDRVTDVWQMSGRRLIAGMSYLGDWEKRCIEVLEDLKGKRAVVYVDDLHQFGKLGQSRESERCFADFFRGPLARGEIVLVGETTSEQWRRLEDDAPSFAALFTKVVVAPTGESETLRMLVHEMRELELKHELVINPFTLRTVIELGSALFAGQAFPGKALDMLRQLGKRAVAERLERNERGADRRGDDEEPEVGPGDVIRLIAARTGLPEVLLRLDLPLDPAKLGDDLGRHVLGQPVAIGAAVDLITRIKTGLVDPARPFGVYLFTGPTGTGKTELAKCIAEYLYGSVARLLRFDMSEFATPDAASRLVGDRWKPEGSLTQQVMEQPFCVVLFDEIEKAHPAILNLLLQLFDEGRLTDAAGNTARFTQAVVIMTSNLGASPHLPAGFGDSTERQQHDVARAVRDFFPPELFNRIDRIVPFRPLTAQIAVDVARKELTKLLSRQGLVERNVFAHATPAVVERVAREAFAQQDGARSLKRFLEGRIGSQLAEHVAAHPSAAMQVIRLFDRADGFFLHAEPLDEASPIDASWALEELLSLTVAELRSRLPEASAFLEALQHSDALTMLSERIGHHLQRHTQGSTEDAESLYTLDQVRAEVLDFRARIDELSTDDSEEAATFAMQKFQYETLAGNSDSWSSTRAPDIRVRMFDRREIALSTRPARERMLAALAEVQFLGRVLDSIDDPRQHAIFIELLQVHHGVANARFVQGDDPTSLLSEMVTAYVTHRGRIEEWTAVVDDKIVKGHGGVSARELSIKQRPSMIVLKLVGVCVLDFFELDTGCHVWQRLTTSPEILRIKVTPAAPGEDPSARVARHREGKKAFEEAIERGADLPENPEALLPVVRVFRFDPPPEFAPPAALEVEDFPLAYSMIVRRTRLADSLPFLWQLRMSRRSPGPASVPASVRGAMPTSVRDPELPPASS